MNNFVFSQDPLLYTTLSNRQMGQNDFEMKKQLDDAIKQYQLLSQNVPLNNQVQNTKDYLGELDDLIRDLDEDITLVLSSDIEYLKTNEEIQKMIQEEMMKSVKWKINSNPDAVNKMERIKELIFVAQKNKSDEDRKNMADINEYIKNYSDLTFEEYKELKYGK